MKQAFTYMFKDNKLWAKTNKYIISAFIFYLISMLIQTFGNKSKSPEAIILMIIGLILSILTTCLMSGYQINCIKSQMIENPNGILPPVNLKNNFILGLKMGIAILVPVIIAIVVGLILVAGICGLTMLNNKSLVVLLGTICFITFILFIIIMAIYSPAFMYLFAKAEKFNTFIRFKSATRLMSADFGNYMCYWLVITATNVISQIIIGIVGFPFSILGAFVPHVEILPISIISAIIVTYTMLACSYLIAHSIPIAVEE